VNSKVIREYWSRANKYGDIRDGMETDNLKYAVWRDKLEKKTFKHIINKLFTSDIGYNVLDVGCGNGRWSKWLSYSHFPYFEVTAIDYSKGMVADAKRKDRITEYIVADVRDFTTDEKYDIIYFNGVLQYINDDEFVDVMSRYKNYLTDIGIIISRDSLSEYDISIVKARADYQTLYRSKKNFDKLTNSAMLQVVGRCQAYEMPAKVVFGIEYLGGRGLNVIYKIPLIEGVLRKLYKVIRHKEYGEEDVNMYFSIIGW